MNKVILSGRMTKDAEVRYTGADSLAVARGTLACDRQKRKDGESATDFINVVAFGKVAELMEKYAPKGKKLLIEGRWQTGSYEKDGKKVYTNDCVIESLEFLDSKKEETKVEAPTPSAAGDGFMNIPDNVGEELPFV